MQKKPDITPAMLRAVAEGRGLMVGSPGAIEASEKLGQIQLVQSTNMPLDLDRAMFEKVGFVFGEKIDDVFQKAILPEGWKREATSHDMHSTILDERGRERVSVFYKAAFYDRRADAYLKRRYSAGLDFQTGSRPTRACIFDGNVPMAEFPVETPESYGSADVAQKQTQTEMELRFPDWADPLAYWDAE